MPQKVTVLTKGKMSRKDTPPYDWAEKEAEKLTMGLATQTSSSHTNYGKLLILGKWTKNQVANVVGHANFSLQVLEGLTNPKLPFPFGQM